MLYLVSTPIGNLADITYRAVELLKSCDLVLCEDKRRTSILFSHYEICTPLMAYHEHNEKRLLSAVLDKLGNGEQIALVSDAGTPLLCDPGFVLAKRCQELGFDVSALPGPCALINALVLSGLAVHRFQFVGFLPRKEGARNRLFQEMLAYPGSSICYETPHRLCKSLAALAQISEEVEVVVAREMTKKHEEVKKGRPSELLQFFASKPALKGEIVLVVEPLDRA